MTERLPDRLRDRLYFAFVSFHERAEVADAIRRGRAVSDPRLAGRAIRRAQEAQQRVQPGSWRRVIVLPTLAALSIAGIILGVIDHDWFVLVYATLGGVALAIFSPRLWERQRRLAKRAEEANERLLRGSP